MARYYDYSLIISKLAQLVPMIVGIEKISTLTC